LWPGAGPAPCPRLPLALLFWGSGGPHTVAAGIPGKGFAVARGPGSGAEGRGGAGLHIIDYRENTFSLALKSVRIIFAVSGFNKMDRNKSDFYDLPITRRYSWDEISDELKRDEDNDLVRVNIFYGTIDRDIIPEYVAWQIIRALS
jgi:hypothetical protein